MSAREQAPLLTPRGLGERPRGSRAELARTSAPPRTPHLAFRDFIPLPATELLVQSQQPGLQGSPLKSGSPKLIRIFLDRLSKPHCPQRSEPSPPPPTRLGSRAGSYAAAAPRTRVPGRRGRRWASGPSPLSLGSAGGLASAPECSQVLLRVMSVSLSSLCPSVPHPSTQPGDGPSGGQHWADSGVGDTDGPCFLAWPQTRAVQSCHPPGSAAALGSPPLYPPPPGPRLTAR